MSKGTEDHMQFTKLTAVLPGVRTGTRSLDKLARLRTSGGGGQALLEFALCLPMLLLIVTGIMTFDRPQQLYRADRRSEHRRAASCG